MSTRFKQKNLIVQKRSDLLRQAGRVQEDNAAATRGRKRQLGNFLSPAIRGEASPSATQSAVAVQDTSCSPSSSAAAASSSASASSRLAVASTKLQKATISDNERVRAYEHLMYCVYFPLLAPPKHKAKMKKPSQLIDAVTHLQVGLFLDPSLYVTVLKQVIGEKVSAGTRNVVQAMFATLAEDLEAAGSSDPVYIETLKAFNHQVVAANAYETLSDLETAFKTLLRKHVQRAADEGTLTFASASGGGSSRRRSSRRKSGGGPRPGEELQNMVNALIDAYIGDFAESLQKIATDLYTVRRALWVRDAFDMDSAVHQVVIDRVNALHGPVSTRRELAWRRRAAEVNGRHPQYQIETLGGDTGLWERWREQEVGEVDNVLQKMKKMQDALEYRVLGLKQLPKMPKLPGFRKMRSIDDKDVAGVLFLRVLRARNLKAADHGVSSDPYVYIRIDKQTQRTGTRKKTCHPVFNDDFTFFVTNPKAVLKIDVYDKDKLSRDEHLGRILFSFDELKVFCASRSDPIWLPLAPKGKRRSKSRIVSPRRRRSSTQSSSGSLDASGGGAGATAAADDATAEDFGLGELEVEIQLHQLLDIDAQPYDDFHKLYHMALKVFLAYENPESRVAKGAESTEFAADLEPLRDASRWCLDEFAFRYGVSSIHRELSLLDIYVRFITLSVLHLETTLELLRRVYRWSTRAKRGIVEAESETYFWTTKDQQQWEDIKTALLEYCHMRIVRYKQVCPENKPEGVLKALADIVAFLVDVAHRPDDVADDNGGGSRQVISDWIAEGIEATYQRLNLMHSTDQCVSSSLSVEQLTGVTNSIISELDSDITYFSSVFMSCKVPLLSVTSTKYYDLLYNDIIDFFSQSASSNTPSLSLFDLYFAVRSALLVFDRLGAFKRTVPPPVLPVGQLWHPALAQWLVEIGEKMNKWAENAVKVDTWERLSDEDLYSSSVVDLFSALNQTLTFVQRLRWPHGDAEELLYQLAYDRTELIHDIGHIVSAAVIDYAREIEKCCLEDLAIFQKTQKSSAMSFLKKLSLRDEDPSVAAASADASTSRSASFTSTTSPRRRRGDTLDEGSPGSTPRQFTVSETLCVRINNLEACREHLLDLSVLLEDLDPSPEPKPNHLKVCFRELKQSVKSLTGRIDQHVHEFVVERLNLVLGIDHEQNQERKKSIFGFGKKKAAYHDGRTVEQHFDPLQAYMNCQLKALNDNLYFSLFKRVLVQQWKAVFSALVDVVLPRRGLKFALVDSQLKFIVEIAPLMEAFFNANGIGVSKDLLERDHDHLMRIVGHYDDDCDTLMLLHAGNVHDPLYQEQLERLILLKDTTEGNDFVKKHRAAKKIQANWRGFKSRTSMSSMTDMLKKK